MSVSKNISVKVIWILLWWLLKNISVWLRRNCLRIKMCKRVRLRRVKVKGLAQKRQIRESTIPTDLSSKHEVCFMMKSAFKVMDTCLWYLDSGCSRHMTETDLSSRFSSLKKVAMSLLVMWANHRLKGRELSLYLDCQKMQMSSM